MGRRGAGEGSGFGPVEADFEAFGDALDFLEEGVGQREGWDASGPVA